jgi:hypothetical protein
MQTCFTGTKNFRIGFNGVGKMMPSKLRQTTFHIDKPRNAVNVGRCSAYQIHTSPGKQIGHIGTIVSWPVEIPANEEEFPAEPTDSALEQGPSTWFRKIFSALIS